MRSNKVFVEQLEDEFTIHNIGSTLLHELAKGLYDPGEVVREYTANAVDAHRSWLSATGRDVQQPVQVELRSKGISILDYGIGMDKDEIREVKSVAVSRKPSSDIRLTGHKGVGIWAGLSFFERIVVYTTKAGLSQGYELTIEFNKIVDGIADDKDIGSVLNPNFHIDVYEESADEHYTTVTLDTPVRGAEKFLDVDFIRDSIRRICPCEIDPTFAFCTELMEWYKDKGIQVFPIQVNGKPVYRSYPGSVEGFTTGTVTIDDAPVAVYWDAVSRKNSVLAAQPGQLVGYRLVMDGFALGGENPYSGVRVQDYEELKVGQYLEWHIGEVHVTAADLRPNLKRNELEESEGTRRFVGKLRDWYSDVERATRLVQEKRNRLRDYDKWTYEVRAILDGTEGSTLSDEQVQRLRQIHDELAKQDAKARVYQPKGQSYEPKIQALKLVSKERRVLEALIAPHLGAMNAQAEKTADAETTGGAADRDDNPTPSDSGGESRSPSDTLASSPEVAVDVVLALFEEVMNEEFPENTERVQSAIATVKSRIEQLLNVKQVRRNG